MMEKVDVLMKKGSVVSSGNSSKLDALAEKFSNYYYDYSLSITEEDIANLVYDSLVTKTSPYQLESINRNKDVNVDKFDVVLKNSVTDDVLEMSFVIQKTPFIDKTNNSQKIKFVKYVDFFHGSHFYFSKTSNNLFNQMFSFLEKVIKREVNPKINSHFGK